MLPNACPIDCRVAKETQIDRRQGQGRGSASLGTQALNTPTTTGTTTTATGGNDKDNNGDRFFRSWRGRAAGSNPWKQTLFLQVFAANLAANLRTLKMVVEVGAGRVWLRLRLRRYLG